MPASERSIAITDAYRARLAITANRAVQRARQGWQQLLPADLDVSFQRYVAALVPSIRVAQQIASRSSSAYLAAYLSSELGRRVAPFADSTTYVGQTSDGRPLIEGLTSALIGTKVAIGDGKPLPDALLIGRDRSLLGISMDIWSAARKTLSDGIKGHDQIVGWRRVTHPGACGACMALAGKMLEPSGPLRIHGFCECTAEPVVGDVPERHPRPDGQQIFDALTPGEQDQLLGEEKASLLRGGAIALADLVATSQMNTESDWITERPLDQLHG